MVGADLLKMLMLQLYSNPRCIYREYIQNALDSINEAVQLGILPRLKDGLVSILISSNNITIEDNGTGIKAKNAVKYLTDIANSIKNGITTMAGVYGVGRLSGGGYCDILEFETSYKGESQATIVSMDTRILRKLLDENNNDLSAEDAMCQICTKQSKDVDADKHYFIVRLKNVTNSADILLNKEDILQYIKEVAPVDYNVTFNQFINTSEQRDFVERHKAIDKIKVSLNDTTDIEKPYTAVVKGNGDNIEKIRYFELPLHEKFGEMGWGWYAVTDFSGQINEERDPSVGIRLRTHNISLDKNILDQYFKETRGNKYFYGEIFITTNKIFPDSGRQGLAASEEADALIKLIKEYFGILHLVYNKANKLKTRLKAIQDAVDDLKKADQSVIDILVDKRLKPAVQEFKRCASEDNREEINDIISIYKEKYIKNLQKDVNLFLAEAMSLQQDASVIKEDSNNPFETKKPTNVTEQNTESKNDNEDDTAESNSTNIQQEDETTEKNNSSDSKHTTTPNNLTTNKPSTKKQDDIEVMLNSLVAKGSYSSEQIEFLRKVLQMMLVVCEPKKKKFLSALIQSALTSIK